MKRIIDLMNRQVLILVLLLSSSLAFGQLGGLGGDGDGDPGGGGTNPCGLPLESGSDVQNRVTGSKTACYGDEMTFYAQHTETSYTWTVTNAEKICEFENQVHVRFNSTSSIAYVKLNSYSTGMAVAVTPQMTSAGSITISNNDPLCAGDSPNQLTSNSLPQSGSGSFLYQWRKKTEDDDEFVDIPGAGGASYVSYSPGNLSETTSFRREVKDTQCGRVLYSNTIKITVIPDFDNGGTITGAKTICHNANAGVLDHVSDPDGGPEDYNYQWEYKTAGQGWRDVSGATSRDYEPGTLTEDTEYQRRVYDSEGCAVDYSNVVKVTVRDELSAGSIYGDKTLDFGDVIGTIGSSSAASGGANDFDYQWEQRVEGGTYTPIPGATSLTYSSPRVLVSNTFFRRRAIDAICGEIVSDEVEISLRVDPDTGLPDNIGCDPDDISSEGSVIFGCVQACRDVNSPIIYRYGSMAEGTSYQWGFGSQGDGYFVGVDNTNGVEVIWTSGQGELILTVNTPQGIITETLNVTITDRYNVGDINTQSNTVCANDDFTLSASRSDVLYWEEKVGTTWVPIENDVQSITRDITQPTTYRYASEHPSCGYVISREKTINVYPDMDPGLIEDTGLSICFGEPVQILTQPASGGSGNITYEWFKHEGAGTPVPTGIATQDYYSAEILEEDTYFTRKATTDCGTVETVSEAFVNVKRSIGGEVSVLTSSELSVNRVTGSVELSNHFGDIIKWEYQKVSLINPPEVEPEWLTLVVSSLPQQTFDFQNIGSEVDQYRIRAMVQEENCSAVFSEVSIPIIVSPLPRISGPECIPIREAAVLTTYPGFYSYQWFYNGQPITGANSKDLSTTNPGDYELEVVIMQGNTPFRTPIHNLKIAPLDINFVRSVTAIEANSGSYPEKFNVDTNIFQENTNYLDGLGRSIQVVSRANSPQGKDIISPTAYDQYGRVDRNYLPYVSSSSSGSFERNDVNLNAYETSHQYNFYQNQLDIANDSYPYAQQLYEPSPLNRVIEQGSSGEAWQPDIENPENGKTIKIAHLLNSSSDNVMLFTINEQTGKLESSNDQASGQLIKTSTTDEEGHRVIEFTDKLGQTVLKRVQAVENPNLTMYVPGEWADTYYVYDDLGNLRFVLPPEAINNIDEYLNN